MKKTFSVLVAVLMLVTVFLPCVTASAAGGQHTVTFIPASESLSYTPAASLGSSPEVKLDAYYFVETTADGKVAGYARDDLGTYIVWPQSAEVGESPKPASEWRFYNTYQSVMKMYIPSDPNYYRPVRMFETVDPDTLEVTGSTMSKSVEDGKVLTFKVMTTEKYNNATVILTVNGDVLEPDVNGVYAVLADRDLTIAVKEKDGTKTILAENFYNVTLTSGDGYRCKTLEGENYKASAYGETFRFRIKITKGFSAAGMTVKVLYGQNDLETLIGEEADFIYTIDIPGEINEELGVDVQTLASYGIDADGYRCYEIKGLPVKDSYGNPVLGPDGKQIYTGITNDCKILVSGVREESSSGFFAKIKKILKLILDFLGIQIPGINAPNGDEDPLLTPYTVTVNNACLSNKVDYEVIQAGSSDPNAATYSVFKGESIGFVVTYKYGYDRPKVTWTPGNENGTYGVTWVASVNAAGETIYKGTFSVENITSDTTITIADFG